MYIGTPVVVQKAALPLEKRKQELLCSCRGLVRDSHVKFFGSFFKKELLPCLPRQDPQPNNLALRVKLDVKLQRAVGEFCLKNIRARVRGAGKAQ